MRMLFQLGQLVATPGAIEATGGDTLQFVPLIDRHLSGDWGDLCDEDKATNADALTHGNRILSAYTLNDTKLWVITERDRSVTTILLPDEY